MQYSEIEHFKDMLLERRRHLTDWLKSEHPGDSDSTEKVRILLRHIKSALDRIENETYGVCKVCHEGIEKETLECRPETETCIDCLSDEEKVTLEADLRMAGQIQRALMPQSLPDIPGFTVASQWLPAGDVGGDYYDFLPCGGDSLSRIVIADAMGKGISGSIVISSLQGALRVLSSEIHSPGKLLNRLNQWLCRNVPVTKFVSLVCVCLEPAGEDRTLLTYANAGHPQPILAHANGVIDRLETTGGVLGVHEDFSYGEGKTYISKGDVLVLYTDGVTELKNPQGEMFDDDGLIKFIKAHQGNPVDVMINHLIRGLIDFSGSSGRLDDDLTIVSLRRM